MRRLSSRLTTAAGLFAVTLGVYAGTYLLWSTGYQDAYLALVRFWGIDAWHTPFLDLTTVLSWSECRQLGYDVYTANPCNQFGDASNYGPLLTHLPFTRRDTQWIGILQSIAFLATAALVIRPRRPEEWAAALLALFSTATMFALERGNVDVIEFLLIAGAGALAMRGKLGRLGAYAIYFLGGALKFYPFALFLMVMRERPKIAIAAAVAAAAAIVLFGLAIQHELAIINANLPQFDYNSDTFGARVLPYGLVDILALPQIVARWLFAALLAVCVTAAVMIATRILQEVPRLNWSDRNQHFLAVGAIVTTSCFLVQTNIDYRAIFFLLLLPGLFDLRSRVRSDTIRRVLHLTIWGIVFCLWGEFVRRTLGHVWLDAKLPARVFFVGRELVWWSVVTVVLAIVFAFLRTSAGARWLLRRRPA